MSDLETLIVFIVVVGLVVAFGILVGIIVAGRIDRIAAPRPAPRVEEPTVGQPTEEEHQP
jgi:hypothetical protein